MPIITTYICDRCDARSDGNDEEFVFESKRLGNEFTPGAPIITFKGLWCPACWQTLCLGMNQWLEDFNKGAL